MARIRDEFVTVYFAMENTHNKPIHLPDGLREDKKMREPVSSVRNIKNCAKTKNKKKGKSEKHARPHIFMQTSNLSPWSRGGKSRTPASTPSSSSRPSSSVASLLREPAREQSACARARCGSPLSPPFSISDRQCLVFPPSQTTTTTATRQSV